MIVSPNEINSFELPLLRNGSEKMERSERLWPGIGPFHNKSLIKVIRFFVLDFPKTCFLLLNRESENGNDLCGADRF